MLFGKKDYGKIDSDNLESFLKSIAYKKLDKVESKGKGIVEQFGKTADEFRSVCKKLYELDAEPYTEDLWNPNINSIKKQKGIYCNVLIGIVDDTAIRTGENNNAYEKYARILDSMNETISGVLKANSNYKSTLYSYSNHMRDIKRTFSVMESLRNVLNVELGKFSEHYEVYLKIRDKIRELNSSREEMEIVKGGLLSLKENKSDDNTKNINADIEEVSKKIYEKTALQKSLFDDITEFSNKINILVAPLSRVARKFDHSSIGKKSLGDFLSNPIESISDEEKHREFLELLADLKKSVDTGHIDVKNRQDVLVSISTLENSGIYSMIVKLKELKLQMAELESEVKETARIKQGLENAKGNVETSEKEADRMEIEVERLYKSGELLKAEIEREFLSHYDIRMEVILK